MIVFRLSLREQLPTTGVSMMTLGEEETRNGVAIPDHYADAILRLVPAALPRKTCPYCQTESSSPILFFDRIETCIFCGLDRFSKTVLGLCRNDNIVARAATQVTELADLPGLCQLAVHRLELNNPVAVAASVRRLEQLHFAAQRVLG